MPGLNQTGPMGQGPMTGRKMGRCSNVKTNSINSENAELTEGTNDTMSDDFRGKGFGMRRGRGTQEFGMGRRNRLRDLPRTAMVQDGRGPILSSLRKC